MVSKKRHYSAVEESDGEEENKIGTSKSSMEINTEKINRENVDSSQSQSLNPMERKKKRKHRDKERHHIELESKGTSEPKTTNENARVSQIQLSSSTTSVRPGIHLDLLLHLTSADSLVREAAAERLVIESVEVQKAYEDLENRVEDEGTLLLEAEKDDGLEDCAPSLRLLVNRLILGTSSPRECARQGFSMGLAVVLEKIPAVKLESVMSLIINKLKVPSGLKGQEARDLLLGRLFTYGSLARSHRLSTEWISNKNTSVIMEFTSSLISLAQKKRYLHEPAIAVILAMLEKLPLEAIERHVLIAPGIPEWLQKAVETGDPDALFFALKLQEMVSMEREAFNKLLPYPFNVENFFSRENLQILGNCFKESTFCLPRIHGIWPFLVNMLIPDRRSQLDVEIHSSTKNKKSRKCNSSEDIIKNIRCFCEVVIEGTLLQSSHDRKHLALNILQLLPHLPSSTINSVLPPQTCSMFNGHSLNQKFMVI